MFYQLKFFNPSLSDAAISAQAGFLISSKTAAQVCTGMLWGRLADSDYGGRKVVLLIGLVGCCVFYLGYGLSRSFIGACVCQVLAGALNSNVALTRCVVAELNPEKKSVTLSPWQCTLLMHHQIPSPGTSPASVVCECWESPGSTDWRSPQLKC